MIWLLDDTPFDHLSSVALKHDPALHSKVRLLVTSTTEHDARQSPTRRNWLASCPYAEVVRVTLGAEDPAAQILQELHQGERTTTNLAEREAIAWAQAHEPTAIFVTTDKRAALTALAELGRNRVAYSFDLWLDLLDHELLDTSEFRELCTRTKQKDQGLERMPDRVKRRFG